MTTEEYEPIARKLRPRLFRIGREFFGDSNTADDVAQEVLMRLWIMRERINTSPDAEALALRMARNICVDEWRRQKTRRAAGTPESLSAGQIPAEQPETETRMADKDNENMLQEAIGRLTKAEQRLYKMRHEQGMDISQITAATGIGSRSVSAMLSTARRKLLEMIKQKGGL